MRTILGESASRKSPLLWNREMEKDRRAVNWIGEVRPAALGEYDFDPGKMDSSSPPILYFTAGDMFNRKLAKLDLLCIFGGTERDGDDAEGLTDLRERKK